MSGPRQIFFTIQQAHSVHAMSSCNCTSNIVIMRPPGWHSGLGHCNAALVVPPETLGSSPGSVVTGRVQEVRGAMHNWPSVVRVRKGLAGRDIPVSSRTSDSCGGPGAVRANQVARCTVFPPTHWCNWLLGWMRAVLRSSVGCVSGTHGFQPSSPPSLYGSCKRQDS
jgi:hypothetical protein